MSSIPIDYAALAKQAGAISSTPPPSGVDYSALAKQAGAISSTPSASSGPNDPNGNYDFGDLGKVQGARMNGRPATRQEAFSQLSQQHDFAQTMGQTFQGKQQDVSNFISSSVDPDQATKGYMGDLAGMLVAGGAPGAARAARWGATGAADIAVQRGAGLAKDMAKDVAIDAIPGARPLLRILKHVAPEAFPEAAPNATLPPNALESQTSPSFFQQFGEQQHLPVTPSPKSYQVFPPDPLSRYAVAADLRETLTAAKPAGKQSVTQLLNNAMAAIDKKYPGSRAAWEASKQEAPPPTQDIAGLLQKSIAAAKSK